jgi:hypothetical protein
MTSKGQIEPPPQTLLSPLLELREHYARITEEYERLYTQARSQLEHVEALLSSWSESDSNHQLAIVEVARGTSTTLPGERLLSLSPASAANIDDPQQSNNLQGDNSPADDINANSNNSKSPDHNEYSGKVLEVPMLPEYEDLTRMEAIKKLLQEHVGTVCHIDFIVRSLYGELEPTVLRVVKGRVQSSLTQGRERNSWFAIPDEPGCYTLDMAALNSKNSSQAPSRSVRPKKKPVVLPQTRIVPMLDKFEGLFLIDALSVLLKQNAGKIFTVAEVISGLYGDIDADDIREIKSKVLNELSRGYRTGRFSKIPDKIGLYTWDVKLALEKNPG